MPVYRFFKSIPAAREAVAMIDRAMNYAGTGQSWGVPIEHPYRDGALVRYRPEMLNPEALAAFDGTEDVDLLEAAKREFYIGPFAGRFGKSRAKLEEAQLLLDALLQQRSRPNQPVVRALFFGFLSTLYALRECLKKVCMAKGKPLRSWWKQRQGELDKNGELLPYLLFVVNRDKHNSSGYIHHEAKVFRVHYEKHEVPPGTAEVRQSAEGLLALVHPGTPKFRRVPFGSVEGQFMVQLVGAPTLHLGTQIAGADLFVASAAALEYFEQAVFEAENLEKQREKEESE